MALRTRRGSFARNLKCLDPDYVDYELDGGWSAAEKNQWFFEVGWEVANKGEFFRYRLSDTCAPLYVHSWWLHAERMHASCKLCLKLYRNN